MYECLYSRLFMVVKVVMLKQFCVGIHTTAKAYPLAHFQVSKCICMCVYACLCMYVTYVCVYMYVFREYECLERSTTRVLYSISL